MLEAHAVALPRQSAHAASRGVAFNLTALLIGTALQLSAYEGVELLGVAMLFYVVCAVPLYGSKLGGRFERAIFNRMFAIGWLMAGVAAVYANVFSDAFQNTSDPAHFFNLATQEDLGGALMDLRALTEGVGAILLWNSIYQLFSAAGFEKARYIGVTVNIAAVALAGVVAVKIARTAFGEDVVRLRRIVLLYSACGLLWLFASIHLRDSSILLAVTLLTYFWVRYLARATPFNLALVTVASVAGPVALGLLRAEFAFVPVAMLLAAVAAIIGFDRSRGSRKLLAYAIAVLGLAITAAVLVALREQIALALGMGYSGYMDELASETQMDESLGVRFIVGAPLPLRLVFGSAYLFVFPIPFWSGFQLESAYHLFKSFNALYFYLLTPLLLLALLRLLRKSGLRTPLFMFLTFLILGFMFAVAGTSLETRHFATFIVPLITVAAIPDVSSGRDRAAYRLFAAAFIGGMVLLHAAWAALKFG